MRRACLKIHSFHSNYNKLLDCDNERIKYIIIRSTTTNISSIVPIRGTLTSWFFFIRFDRAPGGNGKRHKRIIYRWWFYGGGGQPRPHGLCPVQILAPIVIKNVRLFFMRKKKNHYFVFDIYFNIICNFGRDLKKEIPTRLEVPTCTTVVFGVFID